MTVHHFDDVHDERSPLCAAEWAYAQTLLAGVGHDKCTALHQEETCADWPDMAWKEDVSRVREGVGRCRVRARSITFHHGEVRRIGTAFEADGHARPPSAGDVEIRFVGTCSLVGFATRWMVRKTGRNAKTARFAGRGLRQGSIQDGERSVELAKERFDPAATRSACRRDPRRALIGRSWPHHGK